MMAESSGTVIALTVPLCWFLICWVSISSHRQNFGALMRHGYYAFATYLTLLAGGYLVSLAIPSSTLVLYILGSVLSTAGLMSLIGWAISPGGIRYLVIPLWMIFRVWPGSLGKLPVQREEAIAWDKSSTAIAMLFLVLAGVRFGYIWYLLSKV